MREEINDIFLKENIHLDYTDEKFYDKNEVLKVLNSVTRFDQDEYIDDIKVIDLILNTDSKICKRLRKHLEDLGNKKLLKHFESLIAIDEVINDCYNKNVSKDDIIWRLNEIAS